MTTDSSNNYRKATAILLELQTDQNPDAHRRDENRIPKAWKYQLDPDYRLLIQTVDGEDAFIALCVGNHDHVDSFLDGHKGWVFDMTGNLRELRLASATEEATQIVISKNLQPDTSVEPKSEAPLQPAVFSEFSPEMFARLGRAEASLAKLMTFTDPNDFGLLSFLGEIEESNKMAADLLLAYLTGDTMSRQSVIKVARGEAQYRQSITNEEIAEAQQKSDEIFSYSDPEELQRVLEKGTFQEWELFLHPDQKALVTRHFAGPARIRGISGSGKTVVGLHRARLQATRLLATNTNKHVLYTTFNKALATSAGVLLDSLCEPKEREK